MDQIRKTKRSVVLMEKGNAAAIVQDAVAYQNLLDIAAGASAEEGIRQGLERCEAGEGSAGEGVFRGIRSRAWHTSLISLPAPSATSPEFTRQCERHQPPQIIFDGRPAVALARPIA